MNLVLYFITVFIWGTTWFAIRFQLGVVDPFLSISYRFLIAGLLQVAYIAVAGREWRFNGRDHAYMVLQGVLLFGINYWFVYIAEMHLTSGLVAVLYSTMIFVNILNGRIFLGVHSNKYVLVGALIGILGIGLVFYPEIASLDLSDKNFVSVLLSMAGVVLSSLGNIVSARNQKNGIPVLQANAFGMLYGAVLMFAVSLFNGARLTIDSRLPYVTSLLYLAVLGSIVAFGCYLTLLGRIGAGRAAYATMLFPIIALAFSTVFESYAWSIPAVIGIVLILTGNVIVLNKKAA